jgi:protein-tyrosine phosphatase
VTTRLAHDRQRILDWDGCHNVRDAGGLATSDGRRIRPGALVRSDVLCRLTPTGRRSLVDHGVRTIIDVRSAEEVGRDWDAYPFPGNDADGTEPAERGVAYRNIPFTTGRDEHAWEQMHAAYLSAETRAQLNRIDLDANGVGIAAAVAAVAEAPPGGVLIHCYAGKDRTGLVVAMLLSLAGVDDEDIADDYALTALNLEPLIVDWLDEMTSDEAERERLRVLAQPDREAMLDSLAHVRGRHGSVEAYLRLHGVTDGDMERIRRRLVE